MGLREMKGAIERVSAPTDNCKSCENLMRKSLEIFDCFIGEFDW